MISPSLYENPLATLTQTLANDKSKGLFKTNKKLEVIAPKVEAVGDYIEGEQIMRHLESAIRTAYKSEEKIGPGSAEKILSHILSLKHESTLEHFAMTFRVTTCRGVTHEIVRHRVGHSFTQESTRYVNYGKRPPQVVMPWHLLDRSDEDKAFWLKGQRATMGFYQEAIKRGWVPQDARGFLQNDLKTEIVWTMNLRAARHMCSLRVPPSAHPDMQVIAREICSIWYQKVPLLFQDLQTQIESRYKKETA